MIIKPVRWLFPPIVLALGVYASQYFLAQEQTARVLEAARPVVEVEVLEMHPTDYRVQLLSYGSVEAEVISSLIPEVSGVITQVSPDFTNGGYFNKHQWLIKIDDRDYANQMTIAEAVLQQATSALQIEQARSKQARIDWRSLGRRNVEPDSMVLRKPQLSETQAAVSEAKARLQMTQRSLERTVIRAPFEGRVLRQLVDIGQYVSPGVHLAEIYADDYAEVRLPLTDRQMMFINLPTHRSLDPQQAHGESSPQARVELSTQGQTWQGIVTHSEGTVDTASRLHFVVARVQNHHGSADDQPPDLKVGTFVHAAIEGKLLKDVFVVPRRAADSQQQMLVVNRDGSLQKIRPAVPWSSQDSLVVKDGIQPGTLLCLPPWPVRIEGTNVKYHIDNKIPHNQVSLNQP